MSRIKGKNTKPELLVFYYLRKQKIYFQKHYRTKQGIVLDLALPGKKRAVFIDGDFWHGRTLEGLLQKKGDDDFWVRKLKRNIDRDNEQRGLLIEDGWDILAVWESDLIRKRTQTEALESIKTFLQADEIPSSI